MCGASSGRFVPSAPVVPLKAARAAVEPRHVPVLMYRGAAPVVPAAASVCGNLS
jgi:hypothetical protein